MSILSHAADSAGSASRGWSVRHDLPGVPVGHDLDGPGPDLVAGERQRLVVAAGEVLHEPLVPDRRLRTGEGEDRHKDVGAVPLRDVVELLGRAHHVGVGEVGLAGVHDRGAGLGRGGAGALEEQGGLAAVHPHHVVLGVLRGAPDARADRLEHLARQHDEVLAGLAVGRRVVGGDGGLEDLHETGGVGDLRADRLGGEGGEDGRVGDTHLLFSVRVD